MLAGLLLNLPKPQPGKRRFETLVHEEVIHLGCISICECFEVELQSLPAAIVQKPAEVAKVFEEISDEDILALLFTLDL